MDYCVKSRVDWQHTFMFDYLNLVVIDAQAHRQEL